MILPAVDFSSQDDSHEAIGSSVSLTRIQGSMLRALAFHVHQIRGLITLSDNHRAASTIAIYRLSHTKSLDLLRVSFSFLHLFLPTLLSLSVLILKKICYNLASIQARVLVTSETEIE